MLWLSTKTSLQFLLQQLSTFDSCTWLYQKKIENFVYSPWPIRVISIEEREKTKRNVNRDRNHSHGSVTLRFC